MKKIRLLLITVVALILLLALSSCGTSSAKGVYKKINTAMSKLDSFSSETTITVSVNMNGQHADIDGYANQSIYHIASKDCYIYSETSIYTVVDESVTSSTRMKAYYDGYGYSYASTGGSAQNLCSPISRKDFIEYYQYNTTDSITADLFDCENRTFSQNENGSWEVCFSGFSQESVNSYLATMGLDATALDDKAIDIEICMRANSKFIATSTTTTVIFEDNRNLTVDPKIESVTRYSEYDEVVPKTDNLNPDYYQHVADIRLVDGIEYMIAELQNKKSDRFFYSVTQSNGRSEYTEENIVRYGTTFGKFYYEIDGDLGGTECTIEYRDGEKTTTKDGKSKSEKVTEAEAKSYIKAMIGSTNYNAMYVDDVVLLEDGRYKVTLDIANVKAYEQLMASMGVKYTGADQTMYITIKREKIELIENELILRYSGGELKVTTVLDF